MDYSALQTVISTYSLTDTDATIFADLTSTVSSQASTVSCEDAISCSGMRMGDIQMLKSNQATHDTSRNYRLFQLDV